MSEIRRQNPQNYPDDDISMEEVLYWAEFAAWTSLALAPFLYWVNGPAVSTDQAVVRTILVVGALIVGIGLRTYKLWTRKRKDCQTSVAPDPEH